MKMKDRDLNIEFIKKNMHHRIGWGDTDFSKL